MAWCWERVTEFALCADVTLDEWRPDSAKNSALVG
jgi:hypothetical protein